MNDWASFRQLPFQILVLAWIILRPKTKPTFTTREEIYRYAYFLGYIRGCFPRPQDCSRLQLLALRLFDAWHKRQIEAFDQLFYASFVACGWLPVDK